MATIDSRADFDPVTHRLSTTSLTGGYAAGGASLNLTWFSGYAPTGEVMSSQTRLFFSAGPPSARWHLESQLAYDIHSKKLLDQRYVFRWRGSCWNARVEMRDYRIAPNQTRDFRISIDLTGLGTFLDIKGATDTLSR
jgi:hypothetical protein